MCRVCVFTAILTGPSVRSAAAQEFVARVDRVSADRLDVTLMDGATDVNRELGGSTPAPAPAAAAPPKKVTFSEPVASRTAPAVLPAPESRRVAVSCTVSPAEFYTQDAAMADQLDELMTQLDAEYSLLKEGERAVHEVGGGGAGVAPTAVMCCVQWPKMDVLLWCHDFHGRAKNMDENGNLRVIYCTQ